MANIDPGQIRPEDCPNPSYHETHYYCPSCSFRSEGTVDYGLVLPFVNVKSKGGRYDDDAFVAGYECGSIDRQLMELGRYSAGTSTTMTVHTDNLDQLDLIAMHRACVMERKAESGDETWTQVTFRRDG